MYAVWLVPVTVCLSLLLQVAPVAAVVCNSVVNFTQLDADTANVRFSLTVAPQLTPLAIAVYVTSANCYECAPRFMAAVNQTSCTMYMPIDTTFAQNISVVFDPPMNVDDPVAYGKSISAQENAYYSINFAMINNSSVVDMSVITDRDGDNSFVPLYIAAPVILLLITLVAIITHPTLKKYYSANMCYRINQGDTGITNGYTTMDDGVISLADDPHLRRDDEKQLGLSHSAMSTTPTRRQRKRPSITINTSSAHTLHTLPHNLAATNAQVKKTTSKQRLLSLDTFRGLALSIMIFVNYGGGSYWFFNHSAWNGLTVADLVFPWFVWMMGAAMPMSFDSMQRKRVPLRQQFQRVFIRSVELFVLGIIVSNSGSAWDGLRIMGVLQRFSLSYFVVACIIMFVPKLGSVDDENHNELNWHADMDYHLLEWLVVFILLVGHTMITFFLPVPGCPTGYLGPGGRGSYGAYYDCVGGAAGYIDRYLLGYDHIFHGPTCSDRNTYACPAYDPEGLLGTLTSIGMCYFGVIAGRIIIYYSTAASRIKRWIIWFILSGIAAALLCEFSQNEGVIPVNKNLWSLSFILTLSSFAFALLTFLYLIIDVMGVWNGVPFKSMGMNSIVVYFASETLGDRFPFSWNPSLSGDGIATHSFTLGQNLFAVGLFMCGAAYLDWIGCYFNL